MQIIDLKNKPIVSNVTKRFEAFQGVIYTFIVVIFFAVYGYFFSVNLLSLQEPAKAQSVPLSPEIEALKAQTGVTFDGSEILKKNIEGLKDNTEHITQIIEGPKGRTNPFETYAPSRSSR